MFGLLQQARFYANLTPGERALLRFGETLLIGAVLAGVQAALKVLAKGNLNAIDWQGILHTFLAAALMALYLGVSKYLKAHGDPPLPRLSPTVSQPSQ